MGNTCSCIRHLNDVPLFPRGGSIDSGHNGAIPSGLRSERGSSSDLALERCVVGERLERARGSRMMTSCIEDRIERSKVHWSQLTECESDLDNEEVVQENSQVFEELQSHFMWGSFFKTFGYDTENWVRAGELVVGEKFAEGGQAELFHTAVNWRIPELNKRDLEEGVEWVVKVFKKGTRLRKLQAQWPHGYLQVRVDDMDRYNRGLVPRTQIHCNVYCGTLFQDGRFAFLMVKEHEDLRSRIDQVMLDVGNDHGPFSKDEVERIIFHVARGMEWLHKHNILHRDLKASNVLVEEKIGFLLNYYVADFECSIGVVGTGYFMAPEILQALKNKVPSSRIEAFSKEADVYSYGILCYEVLTGKLPFEGHRRNDYDLVLDGGHPRIPGYVDSWIKELLSRCWDVDCSRRPLFPEIMEIISSNSASVREAQADIQKLEEDYAKKHEEKRLQRRLVAYSLDRDFK